MDKFTSKDNIFYDINKKEQILDFLNIIVKKRWDEDSETDGW